MVAHATDSLNLDSNHLCYFVGALPAGMAGRSGLVPRGGKPKRGLCQSVCL
jgi:hypothetical protein